MSLLVVCLCLMFSPVYFLMFEKWSKPSAHHGAPLNRQQISGGARQNVQPDVQESLPVQTSSSAREEGERLSFINWTALFLSLFVTVASQPACGLLHAWRKRCAAPCRWFTPSTALLTFTVAEHTVLDTLFLSFYLKWFTFKNEEYGKLRMVECFKTDLMKVSCNAFFFLSVSYSLKTVSLKCTSLCVPLLTRC